MVLCVNAFYLGALDTRFNRIYNVLNIQKDDTYIFLLTHLLVFFSFLMNVELKDEKDQYQAQDISG